MPPDELYDAYQMADLLEGKIPHWHRAKGDSEPGIEPPFDAAFDDALERGKQEACRPFHRAGADASGTRSGLTFP